MARGKDSGTVKKARINTQKARTVMMRAFCISKKMTPANSRTSRWRNFWVSQN